MAKRLIVIGAGPMGLEAALGASERGFDVTVLEKGEIGASLRRAGSTRFFSPFSMNFSERAKRLLGDRAPPKDALLTCQELADRVLIPLANSAPLSGRVRTGHRVISVGRARMTRTDMPSHPLRAERVFRVLVEKADGSEETLEAECVLDASGVYDQPSHLGAGNMPAQGERAFGKTVIRHLGVLESQLGELAGRRVLLVGSGASAANALLLLDRAARESPSMRITWAVRGPNARPCVEVANDPLQERRDLIARVNALAESPPAYLTVERRAQVEAISRAGAGALSVRFTGGRAGEYDAIAAFTGYRPDHSITAELAVEISPISDGAGRIQRALACVTDCLNVPCLKPDDLRSGEPGFHFAGIKSYGRTSNFLLQTGIAQLETMLDMLASSGEAR